MTAEPAPEPVSPTSSATPRDRIVAAAMDLVVAYGYQRLRMRDVADAAGVSRQTVYNEFGDKWGLAQAVVMRDTELFLDDVDAALARHDDLTAAVTEAVYYSLTSAASQPLRKAVLTGDGRELLPLLTTEAEPQLFAARTRLVEHVRRHWPGLPQDEVAAVVDAAVRLTMSHMMLPSDPPDVVAARIAAMVTRYLGV
ncbi:MAG TPA: TetR family transcriptional regulator [Streptosporangiaceae bacterium]|jgi:AcrR family transcriptional regulator